MPTVSPGTIPPFDLASALQRVDGEEKYIRDMATVFAEDYPGLRDQMREALAKGDGSTISFLAHRLAGSLASFSARPAEQAVRKLEALGKGDLKGAEQAFEAVDARVHELLEALRARKLLPG